MVNQNWPKNVGLSLLSVYFFTAGIHQIPSVQIDMSTVFLVKRLILAGALVHMVLCINWQSVIVKKMLKIFALWLLVLILNLFIHGNLTNVTLKILQSTTVLVIVCFFMQNFHYAKDFFRRNYFIFLIFIFSLLLIFVAFFFFEDVRVSISTGFGGNRVNFSIWLSQFTVLFSVMWYFDLLPFSRNSKVQFLCYTAYLAPLFLLQLLSGGRLGILTSLMAIVMSVLYKFKGRIVRQLGFIIAVSSFFYLFYLSVSLWFQSVYFSLFGDSKNIFRGVVELSPRDVSAISKVHDLSISSSDLYFNLCDYVVSYRLTLFVEGLKAFDLKMFLFGLGFENFQVQNYEGFPQKVHNVFLNSLGEIGVFGFLLFCFIILFPFFALPNSKNAKIVKIGMGIWFIQAFFQPEFFYSQIGNSLCFWVFFAYALKWVFKVDEENYEI